MSRKEIIFLCFVGALALTLRLIDVEIGIENIHQDLVCYVLFRQNNQLVHLFLAFTKVDPVIHVELIQPGVIGMLCERHVADLLVLKVLASILNQNVNLVVANPVHEEIHQLSLG